MKGLENASTGRFAIVVLLLLSGVSFFGCEGKREMENKMGKTQDDHQIELEFIDSLGKELPLTIKRIQSRLKERGINTGNSVIGMRSGGMIADPDKIYGTIHCGDLKCFFQADLKWPIAVGNDQPQPLVDIATAWDEGRGPGLDCSIIRFHVMKSD